MGDAPQHEVQARTQRTSCTTDLRGVTGNKVKVLHNLTTMCTPFARVVDYRTYRLNNMSRKMCTEEGVGMCQLKKRIDGFHPTLSVFRGEKKLYLIGLK